MDTYQSTGKVYLSVNSIRAEVKTNLPILKNGGAYKFKEFYNISSEKYFGVLAILIIEGENNTDLNFYPSENVLTQIVPNIDLNKIKNIRTSRDFSELTIDDEVNFICYHDDTFKENEVDLLRFQESLPNIPSVLSEINMFKPKAGNGGILAIVEE